jgi:hypothetical protein
MQAHGYAYEASSLRNMWQTAAHFPKDSRKSFGWHIHHLTGSPEMLETVIAGAPRGARITITYVQNVMRALALARQEELDAETERRQEEAERARIERERAEEDKRRAKSAREKTEAQARIDRAKKKHAEAKAPPKVRDLPKPKPKDIPILVARVQFMADTGQIERDLRKLRETFEPLIRAFPDVDVEAGHERLMRIAEGARAFADLIRQQRPAGRASHLSVVGNGD